MYSFSNFTQKANSAMNSAIDTAGSFGHTFIGSEHILVGLAKTDDCVASTVLAENGITLKRLARITSLSKPELRQICFG